MTSDWDTVGKSNYVAFTSYRKDGTPVATPVWIVPSDGKLYFISETETFKVKRVRRNSDVTLQPCDARGKVKPGAPVVQGSARLLDYTDTPRVRKLINRKYWLLGPVMGLVATLTTKPESRTPIEISPR